jgi:hypothetical protein
MPTRVGFEREQPVFQRPVLWTRQAVRALVNVMRLKYSFSVDDLLLVQARAEELAREHVRLIRTVCMSDVEQAANEYRNMILEELLVEEESLNDS